MSKLYRKKQGTRTKDKGVTRNGILAFMSRPRTIPELKYLLGSHRYPLDVSIKTAVKNMIDDGVLMVVQRKYSAYDAVEYQKAVPF